MSTVQCFIHRLTTVNMHCKVHQTTEEITDRHTQYVPF